MCVLICVRIEGDGGEAVEAMQLRSNCELQIRGRAGHVGPSSFPTDVLQARGELKPPYAVATALVLAGCALATDRDANRNAQHFDTHTPGELKATSGV